MEPQSQVTYIAKRESDHTVVARKLTVSPDLEYKFLALPPRVDLRSHSPTGYEFGYAGSGPAQLSLAVLADAIGPEQAVDLYQKFKREFVAVAGGDEFRVTLEAIQEWVAQRTLPPPSDALDVWGESLGE